MCRTVFRQPVSGLTCVESAGSLQPFLERYFGGVGDSFGWLTPSHELVYDRSQDLTVKNLGAYFDKLEDVEKKGSS